MKLVWFSPKVEKRPSGIDGLGLFAREAIAAGEVVVVKGGHVMTREQRGEIGQRLGPAEIQIADELFIGPVTETDRHDGMMHLNHSCDPNVGIQGQIVFAAMRIIAAGEELSMDYATNDDDYEMDCNCRTALCRGRITGQDWRRPELQRRYDGWFSLYLQRRIDRGGA